MPGTSQKLGPGHAAGAAELTGVPASPRPVNHGTIIPGSAARACAHRLERREQRKRALGVACLLESESDPRLDPAVGQ